MKKHFKEWGYAIYSQWFWSLFAVKHYSHRCLHSFSFQKDKLFDSIKDIGAIIIFAFFLIALWFQISKGATLLGVLFILVALISIVITVRSMLRIYPIPAEDSSKQKTIIERKWLVFSNRFKIKNINKTKMVL